MKQIYSILLLISQALKKSQWHIPQVKPTKNATDFVLLESSSAAK